MQDLVPRNSDILKQVVGLAQQGPELAPPAKTLGKARKNSFEGYPVTGGSCMSNNHSWTSACSRSFGIR